MSLELQNINKIIIIDLAFIGDIILATPVTRALKENFPHAEITMMTVPLTAPIAEMNPYVDKVLVYDKKGEHKGLFGMWKAAKLLKPHKFDLAVCMNFATRGAVVSWLAGIPYRLGYDAQHANWFLTCAQSHIRDGIKHETLNHLEVLRPLNISTEDTSLSLIPSNRVKTSFVEKKVKLGIKDKYYIMCPLGSYERKSISTETGAQIINKLQKKYPVYLIGGKKEEAILKEMAKKAKIAENQVLAGVLNLQELTVFIANAVDVVSVDTGPMHIAEAVGTPVVAIFGPTDPMIWGPRSSKSRVIYRKESCSPCWGKGECKKNICIEQITSDDIVNIVLE